MPNRVHIIRWCCALLALLVTAAPRAETGAAGVDPFPAPASLRPAVAFWTRVYVEIGTGEGFVHDARHLGVVYETVRLERPKDRRHRTAQSKRRKAHWRTVLARLAAGGEPRGDVERRAVEALTAALGRPPEARDLSAAANRLRFQLGQRNKFRTGLVRAGAYEAEIRAIFRRFGLPEDLAYLPHVESSFNTAAWSKYGAAGMWQFMPRTGRRFMTVDYVLDERLDPMAASVAAAKLLRHNESVLGSWPLALTAYNHGAAGMRRAVKKLGTRDIGRIVEEYQGRAFGFASRNFYAQFLAARAVASDARRHFGELDLDRPARSDTVQVPYYLEVEHVERYLGVDRETLRRHNPALRPSVFSADKRIPKGYTLKLPRGATAGSPGQWLARVPAEHRHDRQRRSATHVVRSGETLSGIARVHRTSVQSIVALNGLQSRHRIRPGQRLELLAPRDDAGRAAPRALERQSAKARPARRRDAVPSTTVLPVASSAIPSLDARWRQVDGEEILVDAGETIGHFAGWLDLPTRELRRINGLSSKRFIRTGQRLQVNFTRVSAGEFVRRREAHHREVEARFLERHRITGVRRHELRSGENLWVLATEVYELPDWLIHRYNPDTLERRLTPGTTIKIPVVETLSES